MRNLNDIPIKGLNLFYFSNFTFLQIPQVKSPWPCSHFIVLLIYYVISISTDRQLLSAIVKYKNIHLLAIIFIIFSEKSASQARISFYGFLEVLLAVFSLGSLNSNCSKFYVKLKTITWWKIKNKKELLKSIDSLIWFNKTHIKHQKLQSSHKTHCTPP